MLAILSSILSSIKPNYLICVQLFDLAILLLSPKQVYAGTIHQFSKLTAVLGGCVRELVNWSIGQNSRDEKTLFIYLNYLSVVSPVVV